MQPNSTPGVPPTTEGNLSFLQRLIQLFIKPSAAFAAVRQNPRWITPAIVVLLLTAGMTWYLTPAIQKEQRERMTAQMEKRGMDQEQIATAVEGINKPWMKYMMLGSAVVGSLLVILAMAGIWLLVAKSVLGGEACYAHMLEVVSLSMIIPTLGMLFKAPIIHYKETMNVHFSLATFMPDSSRDSFLYKFLMNSDFFNIWFIAVLCIGIAVVSGLKVQKVWPVVVGLLVVWYLASAAIGGLFA
ncbi:MAG TPA: YIP1 family protein [bacterium]|nr:YIP1 family protein [bacterium]HQG45417.1 YIP1 family protein [bacterium]HQI47132.1 YIP1 family protein [bacterium]HQJ63150.1 YIP1 family protein [bacterium]